MGAEVYKSCCRGCKISQGIEELTGGIIELDGNWILNHYSSEEGFLGWMALQPRFHRMELKDLTADETRALGGNIQNIDIALRQYWAIRFRDDLIQRVYLVYFFESTGYHLHIHLVPRTKKFYELEAEGCSVLKEKKDCPLLFAPLNKYKFIAWNICRINKHKKFPQRYQTKKGNKKSEKEVEALMTYLRGYLWKLPAR